MKKFVPVVLVVVVLGVLALILSKPTAPNSAGGASGGEVTLKIISPNNENIRKEFEVAFRAWHQAKYGEPVAIEWQDVGGGSDDEIFIQSEFKQKPDGIGIDIFWGGGAEPYIKFAEQGLIVPIALPPDVMAGLPPMFAGEPVYDPKFRWFGTAMSGFGIIFNKPLLAKAGLPAPKTWAAFSDPKAVDQVVSADPRNSSSAFKIYQVILGAYGWADGWRLLHAMSGNIKSYQRAASDVPKLVSLGEAAMGPAIDFYAWTQIAADGEEKIGFVVPEGLSVVTTDAIGVLKGAPHTKEAVHFVEFVLSEAGQKLWILPKGTPGGPQSANLARSPVRPDLFEKYRAVSLVKIDLSKFAPTFTYDADKEAKRADALRGLIGAQLIDTQPELKTAWAALIKAGQPAAAVAKFNALPVTEEELTKVAQEKWADPIARNELTTAWVKFAKEKYAAVIDMCK